jgi:hypothetical protein
MATSSFVGTITAFRMSESQPSDHRLHEVVGGFLGGLAGGRLPDVLEPPLNPNHRGFAHSVTATATILKAGQEYLECAQQWLRERADSLEARAALLPANSVVAALLRLIATLCRIAAGFLAGLAAGYVTHVVLDAFTPRSVRFA